MDRSYEADVSVSECWAQLSADPDSFLIDVRTSAEWSFVGLPLLPQPGASPILVEWQSYPSMAVDPGFAARVDAAVSAKGGTSASKLYFLCRSGARSMGSAAALTAASFAHCFNIADGFEGPPDEEGHRGRVAGWKAAGLPWVQK